MRLRARPYLHYAPTPDGVYLAGGRDQLVLRGSALLFRVADTCVPLLDVGTTEDEMVTALGTERARPAVRHLVDQLRGHHLLLDFAAHTVAEPDEAERQRWAGPLAYLEAVSADPYAAFAAVRAARVAVVGPVEVTGPAVRGLLRAGIGAAEARDATDDLTGFDAVIRCFSADEAPEPGAAPVLPVLLDDRVLVAGPLVSDAATAAVWPAWRDRVLEQAAADGVPPAARPVADALAGALAAHLLFTIIAGQDTRRDAHVVHSDALTADRVVLGAPLADDERWHLLDDAQPVPLPTIDDLTPAVSALTTRWTGPYTRGDREPELPQLPLSQRELAYRDGRTGSVFAAGPDLQTAYVAAAIEGMRRAADGGAAGLTEETWLLDGVLRLLAAEAEQAHLVDPADLDPETRRIRQSLGAQPHVVDLRAVPGLDWRLARVRTPDGETLGVAWGPDTDTAVRAAVGVAVTAAQVRAAGGEPEPALHTDALLLAGDGVVDALRKQVTALAAATGRRFRGRARHADPVLGELPFWYGPVEVTGDIEEQTDGH
ncbi:hypothetical protein [Micromonospora sp. NPDC049274]|uniref:hypothetical protein n=1 Tax=Micromonospora sp. NPDC049274 TaxID=3154829 RepID=UPI003426FB79